MKKTIYTYLIAFATVTFSCEDVIEMNLKNSPPQVVVEAVLTDDSLHCKTVLFKSEDFYKSAEYKLISGAKIKVTDDKLNEYILQENADGSYSSNEITGTPNTAYSIQIELDNKVYKALSRMPAKVILDSLESVWNENPHGKGYNILVNFKDPEGEKNYYRFKIYINGLISNKDNGNEILVWDDKVFDGKNVSLPVKHGGSFFNTGDTIRIDMYSIDEKVYNYFLTLKSAIARGSSITFIGKNMMEGSSAPANPNSNIDNGALGYFGAVAVSSKTIIVGK